MRKTILIFAVILFVSISTSEVSDGACSARCVSVSDYNNLSTELSEKDRKIENLTDRIKDLNESKNEYQRLYRKYRDLYLSQDANVTNRELIRVQRNLTFIQNDLRDYSKEVENVKKIVENLKIELAFSLISIAIIDVAARFFVARVRKENSEDS